MMSIAEQRHQRSCLSSKLLQEINERTDFRIRGLAVGFATDGLIVSGQAPSFHVKQLAIMVCRQVFVQGELAVVCDIEVRS